LNSLANERSSTHLYWVSSFFLLVVIVVIVVAVITFERFGWFEKAGYEADIPKLRAENPDLWDFDTFLQKQNESSDPNVGSNI
jgi:hypothetical protein